jgi:hypothetical protein
MFIRSCLSVCSFTHIFFCLIWDPYVLKEIVISSSYSLFIFAWLFNDIVSVARTTCNARKACGRRWLFTQFEVLISMFQEGLTKTTGTSGLSASRMRVEPLAFRICQLSYLLSQLDRYKSVQLWRVYAHKPYRIFLSVHAVSSLETLISIYETTRRRIPEHFNPTVNIIKHFHLTSYRLLHVVPRERS